MDGHFGHAHRHRFLTAVENNILHFFSAQYFHPLFAHHPAERIDDIALAAAVRSHHTGYSIGNIEVHLISKRFKPRNFKLF